MEMEVSGYTYNRDATHLLNPDSAEYAKICGGDGIRVEKAVDVLPAIKAAIASPGPLSLMQLCHRASLSCHLM